MQRRHFLQTVGLGMLALPTIGLGFPSAANKRVIVIGAGMAGASAAYHLTQAGAEVTVLEARDRMGGRIHTNVQWRMPIELGANWIHHPDGNPLMPWLEKLNIAHEITRYNSLAVYDRHGKKISRLNLLWTNKRLEAQQSNSTPISSDQDVSIGSLLAPLFSENVDEREQDARLFLREGMENEMAANLDELSAQYYLNRDASIAKAKDILITGGYDRIVKSLLKGSNILLNHEVKEISQTSERVIVTTSQSKFEADFVVVTLPISVLQQQHRTLLPDLPNAKRTAFEKIHMGVMNKVVMKFEKKFWKSERSFLGFQHEGGYRIAVNYEPVSRQPILTWMCVSEAAKKLEAKTDEQIKNDWTKILRKSFPNADIEFAAIQRTHWLSDPFSLGSYSYLPVGSKATDFEAISQPAGRIRFAGEATHAASHSYVHGAYLSGEREALRIIES